MKDVMNDCQGKALREGCHEREGAQMSVSSREKNLYSKWPRWVVGPGYVSVK